ncbi:tetratricopeptide repeat protein [Streptomyces sp. NPDC058572]|uniref:tetratricopeptide repeat protein n=1 Tax=Streptomyces sp. NPDC058572 TaxID=3346546 RepID=UPI003666983E
MQGPGPSVSRAVARRTRPAGTSRTAATPLPPCPACNSFIARGPNNSAPTTRAPFGVAHCLARAYHDIRNHTQARTLAEDLLTRRQRVLGEDPHTLTSAHNIERPKADGSA